MRPYPPASVIPRANPGAVGPNPGGPKPINLSVTTRTHLFQPLTLRSLTLKNRVVVSPMCQYSAQDGYPNDWHLQHLGALASRGPGLVIVEATGVLPNGRITPGDLGIWEDAQVESFARLASHIKAFGSAAGIQIAHAGRKSSCLTPFFGKGNHDLMADKEHDGWPDNVWGPSAIKGWETAATPKEMTVEQIGELVEAFGRATKQALKAGFDLVEIHCAHGYLLHSFLSPLSNQRKDAYGGSFENRTRLVLDVTRLVRSLWPSDKPVFFRLSTSDFADGGWTVDDSVKLCAVLKGLGVDAIDCSSGGLVPQQKGPFLEPAYNVPPAERIRKEVGIVAGAPGNVTEAKQAEALLAEGRVDLVIVAREFLRNPNWVLDAAQELGVEVEWPWQYRRAKPRM
ncbi:hypothetical protein HK101_005162 [Irineochytrium annulatum]|nr:hypothetical protein HK101_005162 [Irineochytrium annulatum]